MGRGGENDGEEKEEGRTYSAPIYIETAPGRKKRDKYEGEEERTRKKTKKGGRGRGIVTKKERETANGGRRADIYEGEEKGTRKKTKTG